MLEVCDCDIDDGKDEFFKENRWWIYPTAFFWAFLIVLAVFCWLGVFHQKGIGNYERAAQYGDSFGYVNALFSGLALAGVVLALIVQVGEFNLAEKERTEGVKQQRLIAEQTSVAARAQMADSLLAIHHRRQLVIVIEHNSHHQRTADQFDQLIASFPSSMHEQRLASSLRRDLSLTTKEHEATTLEFIIEAGEIFSNIHRLQKYHTELWTAMKPWPHDMLSTEKFTELEECREDVRKRAGELKDFLEHVGLDKVAGDPSKSYRDTLAEIPDYIASQPFNEETPMPKNPLGKHGGSVAELSIAAMLRAYCLMDVRVIFDISDT